MSEYDHISGIKYLKTIAIRHGNDNQQPCAVYVSGISATFDDTLICNELNTGNTLFGGELEKFDYQTLEKLRAEWRVENAKRSVVRLEKQLSEYS